MKVDMPFNKESKATLFGVAIKSNSVSLVRWPLRDGDNGLTFDNIFGFELFPLIVL